MTIRDLAVALAIGKDPVDELRKLMDLLELVF